jgi:hypothetical protein
MRNVEIWYDMLFGSGTIMFLVFNTNSIFFLSIYAHKGINQSINFKQDVNSVVGHSVDQTKQWMFKHNENLHADFKVM